LKCNYIFRYFHHR